MQALTVFADTSALYAVFDADDEFHTPAHGEWQALVSGGDVLVTSNYVILEAFALLQARLGMAALREFHDVMLPILRVEWIDEGHHLSAVQAVLAAGKRGLSLVDCSSFQLMRRMGIRTAFALDHDFRDQGFQTRPKGLRLRS